MHRMSTQKRRVVYLSDEDWEDLKFRSSIQGVSISEFLRWTIGFSRERWLPRRTVDGAELATFARPPIGTRKMTQAERDAVLRRVNKGG